MRSRWLSTITVYPPYQRVWAFVTFCIYTFWTVILLMLATGGDGMTSGADALSVWVQAWVAGPLVSAVAVLLALRTTARDPHDIRLGLTDAQRGLLAFNVTATLAFLLTMRVAATPSSLEMLMGPFVVAFVVVNALVMILWTRVVRGHTLRGVVGLVVGGVLAVLAGGWGLFAPMTDTAVSSDGVTAQLVAPEGRMLTSCRPLTWTITEGYPNELLFAQFGGNEFNIRRDGEVIVCPQMTTELPTPESSYYIAIPQQGSGPIFVEMWFNEINEGDFTTLAVAVVLMVVLPSMVLVTRWHWLSAAALAVCGFLFVVNFVPGRAVWWSLVLLLPVWWLYARADDWLGHVGVRRALDVAVLALVPLITINVAFPIDRFHVNFWLGAINDIAQGKTLFVDASSQYGIGSQYLMAWAFQLTPIPLSYTR
ncbi:MAG: hypothetical protein AAF125_06785 [Chloroflexota bacterium]